MTPNTPDARSPQVIGGHTKVRQALRVTYVGAAANILLSVAKVAVGWLFSVQSVLADGIHSLSDLISDAVVVVFLRISDKPRSRLKPYGYRKYETLATLLITGLLMLTAAGLVFSSFQGESEHAHGLGLAPIVVIALSVVTKEALFWYTVITGKRIGSPAVVANAWHHRSDALSSLVVLVCLLMASMFGNPTLWDRLGVLIVAAMIVHSAWEIGRSAIGDLLDYAPKAEVLNQIETLAEAVPEVRLVRDVRVRTVSECLNVSLCIEVDGSMTVQEAHDVADRVEASIQNGVPGVLTVLVHVEPTGALAARIRAVGLDQLPDEELL